MNTAYLTTAAFVAAFVITALIKHQVKEGLTNETFKDSGDSNSS